MTQKKSYSRYFIILQEDEKGYALASDKLPSGYAKLEIKNDKCKVSYYVQNLKKESAPYYMVLICNKKDAKKLLKLGELNIDDHGRAEIFHEYPVESVGNCGVNVDKIVGASIVRMMNSNIIPVMSGFASTDIPDWKGFPMVEEDKKRQEEDRMDKKVQPPKAEPAKMEPVPEEVPILEAMPQLVKEVPIVETMPEPVAEEAPIVQTNPEPANIFDEYEMKIEAEKEQMPMEPVQEDIKAQPYNNYPMEIDEETDDDRHKKEFSQKNENSKCEKHDNEKHKECKKDYPKGSVGSFFMDVASGFEELEDMCSEIKRCKWYKVPVHSPQDMNNCLDYNKYTVVYYPMSNYIQYIRKFGHFILGYKLDKENKMKYIVYGIPGTKSRVDQPFGGKSGFVTWVPLKEGDEEEDSYGYWLMFYDFRNSTIVIPVR